MYCKDCKFRSAPDEHNYVEDYFGLLEMEKHTLDRENAIIIRLSDSVVVRWTDERWVKPAV